MNQKPQKTETVTTATTATLGTLAGDEMTAMDTMFVSDDITDQNQTAQLFFEALLQSSRSQLLVDGGLASMNQLWTDGQLGMPHDQVAMSHDQVSMAHDSPMTDVSVSQHSALPSVMATGSVKVTFVPNMTTESLQMMSVPNTTNSVTASFVSSTDSMKMTFIPNVTSSVTGTFVPNTTHSVTATFVPNTTTDSVTMTFVPNMTTSSALKQSVSPSLTKTSSTKSPQIALPKLTIKQSPSPMATAASPKKRSRRQTTGTLENRRTDETMDCGGSSGVKGRQIGLERSVSESSSETLATTPRRRGGHMSEGGRRSRAQSECESDATSDAMPVMNPYQSDDVRRQMAGSVTPETDVGFQPSMLDAVLTEKKLALLRSPEIRKFLNHQQAQRAKERKLTHSSPTVGPKGDHPS